MENTHVGWRSPVTLIPLGLLTLIIAYALTPNLSRTQNLPPEPGGLASLRGEETPRPPASTPRTATFGEGVVAGVPGGLHVPNSPNASADFGRKLVRSSSLQVVVKDPLATAQRIERLAQQLGGFVESSEILGTKDNSSASIVVRVPSSRLEDAKKQISGLAVRVENETTSVTDSTRDYVDREARLRNLHAEEAQYLAIMKTASHIKDMLAVTEKVSDVRGEIEQQQAEFETLSRQVETASLKISLRTEMDTQVFGVQWRPLYQLKLAARDGLDSLASYSTTMLGVIFQLPAAALWVSTILLFAVLAWRVLRWVWRTFLALSPTMPEKQHS
jgi:hypothetical protein